MFSPLHLDDIKLSISEVLYVNDPRPVTLLIAGNADQDNESLLRAYGLFRKIQVKEHYGMLDANGFKNTSSIDHVTPVAG